MMFSTLQLMYFVSFFLRVATDPCDEYTHVPKIDKRDVGYELQAEETPLNDRYIVDGWYGTTDSRQLFDKPPGFQHCGTLNPIWRNETMDTESVMCIQSYSDECFLKFNIQTKLCGDTEIYFLKRSPIQRSAYCFSWPENQTAPTFDEKPTVIPELITRHELRFLCRFNKHPEDIFYKTTWLVDGVIIFTNTPQQWNEGSVNVIDQQALTEAQLRSAGIERYGIRVECFVQASYGLGTKYSTTDHSDWKFIGIKVSNTTLVLTEGQSMDIEFEVTAPIGSAVFLEAYVTEHGDDCNEAQLKASDCGTSIQDMDTPGILTLSGSITQFMGMSSTTANLNLVTSINPSHEMWGGINLGLITVQLIKDTSSIKNKKCRSVNDPHMTTFDNRHYEHQYEGTFTLYKHKELPIEVQIQTARCSPLSTAWCNCAVAVAAGQTVFEFNKCPGQYKSWRIGYTMCEDLDVLQVKKKGIYYEVYLPTGGMVMVSVFPNNLNVHITPSVLDVEQSEGLCGKLSKNGACNDDFYLRDGTYSADTAASDPCNSYRRELPQFSENWSADNGDTNLFQAENGISLKPWPRHNVFCSCPKATEIKEGPNQQVNCTANLKDQVCKTLEGFEEVIKRKCTITEKRRRRRSARNLPIPLKRIKRQFSGTWPGNWTEDSAKSYCESLLNNSRSVNVCKNVEGVTTSDSLENCILDIKLTGLTTFGENAIDSVRSSCLYEVLVNPSFQTENGTSSTNETSSTNKSVYEMVVAEACINDCSGHGDCVDGTCVCNPPYGDVDCSLDLQAAPVLEEIEYEGHCDPSQDVCDEISVYGERFFSKMSTCQIGEYKIGQEASGIKLKGTTISNGYVYSMGEVICSLPAAYEDSEPADQDYVSVYEISVSNNNVTFSNNLTLVVYDATCITGNGNGIDFNWTLDPSYCMYKDKCVRNGTGRTDDECRLCLISGSSRQWINSTGANCYETTTMTSVETSTTPDKSSLTSVETSTTPDKSSVTSVETSTTPDKSFVTSVETSTTPDKSSVTSVETSTTPDKSSVTSVETSTTPDKSSVTSVETSTTPDKSSVTSVETSTTPDKSSVTSVETSTTPDKSSGTSVETSTTPDKSSVSSVQMTSSPDKTTPKGSSPSDDNTASVTTKDTQDKTTTTTTTDLSAHTFDSTTITIIAIVGSLVAFAIMVVVIALACVKLSHHSEHALHHNLASNEHGRERWTQKNSFRNQGLIPRPSIRD